MLNVTGHLRVRAASLMLQCMTILKKKKKRNYFHPGHLSGVSHLQFTEGSEQIGLDT